GRRPGGPSSFRREQGAVENGSGPAGTRQHPHGAGAGRLEGLGLRGRRRDPRHQADDARLAAQALRHRATPRCPPSPLTNGREPRSRPFVPSRRLVTDGLGSLPPPIEQGSSFRAGPEPGARATGPVVVGMPRAESAAAATVVAGPSGRTPLPP